MAVSIPIPDTGWTRQIVSLSGKSYVFDIQYNTRSLRWYINLELNGQQIINSLKVIENINLTGRYLIDDLSEGNLYCVRVKETSEPAGRDNVGLGKDYELLYLTNEEVVETLATIQLDEA